jgi:hypothetical protein
MQVEPQHGEDALDRALGVATRAARAGAVAAAILTVAGTLGMMRFAVPASDDFCRAGRQRPWAEQVRYSYLNWSGRWSAIGLAAALLPNVDLVGAYPWLLVVPALAQVGGVLFLWRLMLGAQAWRRVGLSALLTVAVLWSAMPGTEESVYWFTGVLENPFPLTMMIVCVGCLIIVERSDSRRPRRLLVATAGIVAVLATGMHELCSLALWVVVGLGWIWSLLRRSPRLWAWTTVFALTTAGLAVAVMAPGNAVRAVEVDRVAEQLGLQIVNSPVPRAIYTLRTIADQQRHEVPGWFVDARLLAASVWLLLAAPASGTTSSGRVPYLLPPLALVVWLGLVAIWIAVPTWVIRGWIPGRTEGAAFTAFVLGWMINLHLWSQGPPGGYDRSLSLLRLGAALVLMVGLFTQGTLRKVVQEVKSGRAAAFRAAVVDRDRRSRRGGQSNAQTDLVWEPLPQRPVLVMDPGLSTDPNLWSNKCIALYYRARSARLGGDGVSQPREQPGRGDRKRP